MILHRIDEVTAGPHEGVKDAPTEIPKSKIIYRFLFRPAQPEEFRFQNIKNAESLRNLWSFASSYGEDAAAEESSGILFRSYCRNLRV